MSGRERLQARAAARATPRAFVLIKRVLMAVGLLAFVAFGLTLEWANADKRQALPPALSNE